VGRLCPPRVGEGPYPLLPGKVGTPLRPPVLCVAVPAPHPRRTEGEGLDEVARRALLALVKTAKRGRQQGAGRAGNLRSEG
jgi:hypothetical protein